MGCTGSEVRILSPRPTESNTYSASCIDKQLCILDDHLISIDRTKAAIERLFLFGGTVTRAKRISRSKDDLKRELRDQLQILRMACESFDRGIDAAGKYIAISLRVLLHHHRQSRALLDQLNYRTGRFYSSIEPLDPRNLVSESPMVAMVSGGSNSNPKWMPLVQLGGGPTRMRPIPFSDWWAEKIIDDKAGHVFSRMSLVQSVADTDGGAHVDPDLDEAYMAVSRENSLGWVFGPDRLPLEGRVELACMRQIAHELLVTINKQVPEFSKAAEPVVPPPY
jgi:hypothetical protein